MWWNENMVENDLKRLCDVSFIPWENFRNCKILITGATGLIGFTLINTLMCANAKYNLNLKIIALARDKKRAEKRLGEKVIDSGLINLVIGTVELLPEIDEPIDYIIHGASQTASKMFITQPVETILTAVDGTKNLLALARKMNIKGFVYLSSMEVYGYPEKGHKVKENEIGALTPLNLRNSYPISKLLCENLCFSYCKEYSVPARIIRLAQTFGPGVNYNDKRIFAEFARCVVEKKDIILKTDGRTERSYLYTIDAASAILTVLLKGTNGEVYNVADESTYCSIAKMAQEVADMGGINVKYELTDEKELGYPGTLYMDMDTSLIKELGWQAGGVSGECTLK